MNSTPEPLKPGRLPKSQEEADHLLMKQPPRTSEEALAEARANNQRQRNAFGTPAKPGKP